MRLLESLDLEGINLEIHEQLTLIDDFNKHGTKILGGSLIIGGGISAFFSGGAGVVSCGVGVSVLLGSEIYRTIEKRMQNIEKICVIAMNHENNNKIKGGIGGDGGLGGKNGVSIINGKHNEGEVGKIGQIGDLGQNGLTEIGVSVTLNRSTLEDQKKNTAFILTAAFQEKREDLKNSSERPVNIKIDKKLDISIDKNCNDFDLPSLLKPLISNDTEQYFCALTGEEDINYYNDEY